MVLILDHLLVSPGGNFKTIVADAAPADQVYQTRWRWHPGTGVFKDAQVTSARSPGQELLA